MTLLLVRHAHAGNPERWRGDDRLRPLSKTGQVTARALATVLAPYNPRRIVSSPYVRCVQTVEPLASELGIDIETDERLGEGGAGLDEELVASLITTSGRRDAAVCVTHGDLIANFIMDLEASGVPLSRHEPRWEKGSTWVLSAGEQSHIAKATYIAPPIIAPPIT